VQFLDGVGNSSLTYSATITVDTTVPTGSIAINGGDTYTGLTAVNLALSASDAGAGITGAQISIDGGTAAY
jgi:hypothetical protein